MEADIQQFEVECKLGTGEILQERLKESEKNGMVVGEISPSEERDTTIVTVFLPRGTGVDVLLQHRDIVYGVSRSQNGQPH